ncbi:MAG: alpha/beta hydrolase [Bacteroidia bacterium]|nr:alpha/beta hydrolase [Bacteroidia bacterium]
MQYAEISNAIKLAFVTIRKVSQNKPAILFLHEGMGCIKLFRDFPDLLCQSLKLPGVIYERYGYGHSTALREERPDNYLNIEAEKYLPEFIEQCGLKDIPLILVGHSDGASIALIYASLFTKNVVAVVSIAAHVFVEEISINNVKALEKKYFSDGEFRAKIHKYHYDHSESTLLAFTKTIARESFKTWNIEHCLPKIEAPIFVIQGTEDNYGTQKQVESILTHNQNSLSLLISECGHSPHLEKKQIVIDAITDFLHQKKII